MGDLGLLTGERTLVELVVVKLGVVGLYAVEEEVAGLLKEGVDREVERVEVGCQGQRGKRGVLLEGGEAGREVEGLARGRSRQLVKERGEEVRVVDDDGQLGEDVLVAETALLQAVIVRSV